MPKQRSPERDKAFEIYRQHNGNIDLIAIAKELNLPPGTIRGWKNKDKWEQKLNGTFLKNMERSNKKNVKKEPIAKEVEQVIENPDLTDKQRLFCLYYVKSFNATQSYLKAYGCSYESAMVKGSELLRNVKVREEIQRLKELKMQQIAVSEEDMVEFHMRVAFADIGDYVSFGQEEVPVMGIFGPVVDKKGNQVTKKVNVVRLKDSSKVDTQLIKEVKEGREGISIKLLDRCKSLEWLNRYFLMNPMDKHKIEYDKKKLELLKTQTKIPDSVEKVTIIDDIEGDDDEG